MYCTPKTPEGRRYIGRLWFAMTAYIVATFGATWTFKHHHPQGAGMYLLASLPALPILAVLVIVGLYLAELKDEFERSILVESSLWGTGMALALATFWGFLENYGTVSTIPMFYVFLVWWMSFSLAQILVRRRYK